MKFKIRTKLISAFFAMLVPFSLVFLANYFFTKAVHESIHISSDIGYELENLGDLQLALESLLMPANDYIISGDAEERLDFDRLAGEVEKHLALIPMEKRCQQCHQARTSEMVARLYGREASKDMPEEMLILKEIRDKFEGIKKYGEAIFSIQRPMGSAEAARLMKEMDVLARKAIYGPIGRHRQMEKKDMQKAGEVSEKAWARFQLGRTIGYLAALILGVIIALLYSGRLASVIKLLHKGSDSIAKGDFNASVDIKTGDELEQLADGMNEMAAQLESLYSNLEQKVEERTRELAESEAKFKTLSEKSPNMIFINKRGRVVYANDKCEEIMKYKKEEFYSPEFDFLTLIAPEYLELVKASFDKHMRGEEVEPYEFAVIVKDGRRIEVVNNTALVEYEGEKAILGIITDITGRRKAEEKIREDLSYLERFKKVALKREFRIKELTTEIEKLKAEIEGLKKRNI